MSDAMDEKRLAELRALCEAVGAADACRADKSSADYAAQVDYVIANSAMEKAAAQSLRDLLAEIGRLDAEFAAAKKEIEGLRWFKCYRFLRARYDQLRKAAEGMLETEHSDDSDALDVLEETLIDTEDIDARLRAIT